MQKPQVQPSIQDLVLVQKLLANVENNKFSAPLGSRAVRISLFFQFALFVFSILLMCDSNSITEVVIDAAHDTEMAMLGLGSVLVLLAMILICFYYLVWNASAENGQTLSDFIEVNFRYLKNLSLVSDLLLKFFIAGLFVLNGQGQVIPVLCVLFIADYLIQGRYFSLPLKSSLMTGIICVIAAAAAYLLKWNNFFIPLGIFAIVSLASIAYLFKTFKNSWPQE